MMKHLSDASSVWLIQPDARLSATLAVGLRQDGMRVVKYGSAEAALAALGKGHKVGVLVTAPALGRMTNRELVEQAKAVAPRVIIVFTPAAAADGHTPAEDAHILAGPLDVVKLSRFLRLITARPAPLGALQAAYRQTRHGIGLAASGVAPQAREGEAAQ